MSTRIKWALSVRDWRDHAIADDGQDHPTGVFTTQCEQSLRVVTPLRDTSCGTQYEACADTITRDTQ